MKRTKRKGSPTHEAGSHDHRPRVVSLVVAIAAILILRCFNATLYPTLHCEDGTEMLAYYVNNQHPLEIFRFYSGYVSLLPNMIGFVVARIFPLHLAPYIFVCFSLSMAVAAFSVFSLSRFRCIMPRDRSRFYVCLLCALFPLGNHAIMTTLTYSIWNILIVSMWLIVAPLPKSKIARFFQIAFIALAVCSHPLSLTFVPILCALMFVRTSLSDRLFYATIALVALVYAVLGTESLGISYDLGFSTVLISLNYILQRVMLEPVIGSGVRSLLYYSNWIAVTYVAAAAVLVTASILVMKSRITGPRNKPFLVMVALYVVLVMTCFSVLGRSMTLESHLGAWEHRYFYVQQYAFVFVIVLCMVSLGGWSKLPTVRRAVGITLMVGYFSYLNIQSAPFFSTSKAQGRAVLSFLRSADARLQSGGRGGGDPEELVLDRGGRWDIKIELSRERSDS